MSIKSARERNPSLSTVLNNVIPEAVRVYSLSPTYPRLQVPDIRPVEIVDHDLKVLVRVCPQMLHAELHQKRQVVQLYTVRTGERGN